MREKSLQERTPCGGRRLERHAAATERKEGERVFEGGGVPVWEGGRKGGRKGEREGGTSPDQSQFPAAEFLDFQPQNLSPSIRALSDPAFPESAVYRDGLVSFLA